MMQSIFTYLSNWLRYGHFVHAPVGFSDATSKNEKNDHFSASKPEIKEIRARWFFQLLMLEKAK